MAIGKSGENVIINKLEIKIGDFLIVENGEKSQSYDEKIVKEYMKWDDINIKISLGMGEAFFKVYTCDLTKAYIDINADYRN